MADELIFANKSLAEKTAARRELSERDGLSGSRSTTRTGTRWETRSSAPFRRAWPRALQRE